MRRGGEHEPAATGRTGRGAVDGGRVGARAGAEARTGDGRTARPLSPPAPTTALAAGAPGREPRHGRGPGGERAAAGRRRGVPRVAAEARVPGARTRTRTRPRARTARPDGARAAGGVAGKRARAADARRRGRHRRRAGAGGRQPGAGKRRHRGQDGEPRRTGRRDPTPATTAGPRRRRRVARDRPQPPTPPAGSNTQRPLAARGGTPGGEDRPQKARQARGLGATSRSPSPFSRAASPPRPQSLRGDAVSALRGTEGPAGPARTAPSRAPRRGD